jgi:hypothetical protein
VGEIKITDLEALMEAEFPEAGPPEFRRPSEAKVERFKKALTAENLLLGRTCDNCRNTVNDFHRALTGEAIWCIRNHKRRPRANSCWEWGYNEWSENGKYQDWINEDDD